MALGQTIATPDTLTRFVEHECDHPATRDFVGEVIVTGVWLGFSFDGDYKCPSCGETSNYFENFNPDNEDY